MLHPFMSRAGVDFAVLDQMNCYLARYDEELNLVPDAAESWDFVDEKTVQFNLRPGIMFHNGEELTADDVKFSIEAHLDPDHGSSDLSQMEAVDSVEVVDEYTALVHLKTPYAPLIDLLIDTNHPIVPRSVYEEPGAVKDEPVGCGPFKFKEWRKNAYIELEAYEDYWQEGYPMADGLRFTFLPEYNAAKASLLSQEADVLLMLNLVDVPAMSRTEGIKLDSVPLMGFWYAGMDLAREPFNDPKVREAIRLAIDREPYLKSVLAGFGEEAFLPVPKNSPYYVSTVEYERDVERAKELLAEAGYPDGFETTLTVPKTPEEEPMGVVMQSQLKDIGIDAELVVLDVPTYIDQCFTKKDFDLMICGDTAGPDPQRLLTYYQTESPLNLWNYDNPVVDENITKAGQTFDQAERKGYLDTVYTTAIEDAPMVWLARAERMSAYQDYLDGFVNKPNLRYDFWKLHFVKPKE
jgi:peptide/nickel transport system substrate-binding protein